MWIPEEGCTMGLCEGLSRVRRASVNGPVALMTPWIKQCKKMEKDWKTAYLSTNIPFLTSEVVLDASSVKFAILVLV
jgi:hypothetical protein